MSRFGVPAGELGGADESCLDGEVQSIGYGRGPEALMEMMPEEWGAREPLEAAPSQSGTAHPEPSLPSS